MVTGTPLKNVKELISAFETMNDWVFDHHVDDDNNDFANWVEKVLDEKELAEDIRQIRSLHEMHIKTMKHLIDKYL